MTDSSISQSIHQRLLNIRDKTEENFNNILVKYGLERLLYRLVLSKHSNKFVLKGAMLFSLWRNAPRRSTRDIDLLGYGSPNQARLQSIFTEICNIKFEEDGLFFDPESIRTDDIREDQEYLGIRIRLSAYLGKARIPLQVDVGFGDAVTPNPEIIEYPTFLSMPAPKIKAYHPTTVVAEKLNAMVVLGYTNSRMKDFYDLYIILTTMALDDKILSKAIEVTFDRRKTVLPAEPPIVFTNDFLEDGTKQTQWMAFLNRSGLNHFNLSLEEVIKYLKNRLWPIVENIWSLS